MELMLFENAKRAIAQLQEFDEVREHLDKAAAVQEYARRAKDKDMEVQAAKYRVYCERRAGEMLQGTAGRGSTGRGRIGPNNGDLNSASADLASQDASRYRQLAEVPEESFDDAVEVLVEENKPPTRKRVMDVHYSSESAEHYTPDNVLELVYAMLGSIDLDPCSDPKGNVKAAHRFTEQDDGLSQDWFGSVFMNPPYGREIKDWTRKLREEYEAKRVKSALALVPARVDTGWFNELSAYPVCFVRGRLKFKGNRDAAPFPSAVFYLGKAEKRFITVFSAIGAIWRKLG